MPRGRRSNTEADFWKAVEKTATCWEWKHTCNKYGYGIFNWNKKTVLAHRFSFQLHAGEIPEGALICHTCDNRVCVNPGHLYVGTHKDNARDMVVRNRVSYAKLTPERLAQVREALASGHYFGREIAKRFNISEAAVSLIKNNKAWSLLDSLATEHDAVAEKARMSEHYRKHRTGNNSPAAKLTEEKVVEIKRRLHTQKVTLSAIAQEFGVHRQTIADIKTNRYWAHVQLPEDEL